MSEEAWVPGMTHPDTSSLIAGDVPGMWISTLEPKELTAEKKEALVNYLIEPLSNISGLSPEKVKSTLRRVYKLDS